MVLPFYLLCDVSYSMGPAIQELNDGIARLRRAIVAEPAVDDVAHICIISFSDAARVVLPMTQMSENAPPSLHPEGGTNYGEAFRLLARLIQQDTVDFKRQGYKVYRPCAFFLTDGEPSDRDWHEVFVRTLTYDAKAGLGFKSHPIFVPFGFRDAPSPVLRKLAYPEGRGKWYRASGTSPESALSGILQVISRTMLDAGRTTVSGHPAVILPTPEPGSGIEYDDPDAEWI